MYGAGSSARPLWFALFQERRDPFAEIGAFADAGIFTDGGFNLRIEFGARVIGEQALGTEKREWTALLQLRGEFAGPVKQLFRRNDFIDQAHLQGFRRVKDTAGKQQVASDFFADLAQQESRDDGGHESDPDLGVAKLGFRHGKREIAEQGETGAAGDGRSVDRGNRRFGKFIERTEQGDHGSRVFEILLKRTADQGLQGLEVQTGAEGLPCTGQDQDAGGGVSHLLQSADEIVNQFVAEGVAPFGAVEGDGGNGGVEGELERFVVHGSSQHSLNPRSSISYTSRRSPPSLSTKRPTASAAAIARRGCVGLRLMFRLECSRLSHPARKDIRPSRRWRNRGGDNRLHRRR